MSKSKLAKAFKRREFAIKARLVKLENSPPEAQKRVYWAIGVSEGAPTDVPGSFAASPEKP